MSAKEVQAATLLGPFTNGTDDSNVLGLSMGTTHAAMLFPPEWEGCVIEILVRGTAGKSGWFLMSEDPLGEVDRTIVAAADGGGDPTRGTRVAVGESLPFEVPVRSGPSKRVYLLNETDDASTTADLRITSPKVA